MIQDLFSFGWKNMQHRPLRSWLTIVGVVIGIAAIVSLITIGRGLEHAIVQQFTVLGADRIRVVPEGLTGPPVGAVGLTEDDVEVVKKTIGVDFAGGIIFATSPLEFDNENLIVFVKGLDAELAEQDQIDVKVTIAEGNWFSESQSRVAVIGNSLATNTFDDPILVHSSILIDGEKFKVVGILEPVGEQSLDRVVYIPLQDAREIYNKPEEVNTIFAAVDEGKDIREVADKIQNNLEQKRDDDNFVVFTPENVLNQLNSILTVVQFVLAGIAAISLFVGGIGIMNSMYTSVLERTRQIGLMKAVGASKAHILGIFMLESGLIGVFGGVLGAVLGTLLAFSVQGVASLFGFGLLQIGLELDVIALALLFSFFVGIFSGLLPAYRAASFNPVEALRYE